MTKGGKNLVILGVSATIIAVATTTASLIVYHNSGDIYIDRSRPGFLPDKEEIENRTKPENNYKFSDEKGDISEEEFDEYLLELEELQKNLEAIPDPYSPTSISDDALGIPAE